MRRGTACDLVQLRADTSHSHDDAEDAIELVVLAATLVVELPDAILMPVVATVMPTARQALEANATPSDTSVAV